MKEIYDSSRESLTERRGLRKRRIALLQCDRCGNIPKPGENSQLVIYREAWDRVCNKFREENDIQVKFNRNIVLCPKCMEQLNGSKFLPSEIAKNEEGNWYPCNQWYLEEP